MNPLEAMLRHGAIYWTKGNNGTILAVDREGLEKAGLNPPEICPAFSQAPRIALKIMHKCAPGIAEDERKKHLLGLELLAGLAPNPMVKIPSILSAKTSDDLSTPALLTRVAGLTPPKGGHVEYLLMDWVEGTDFATLVYQAALHGGLRLTREKYGERQMLEELRTIINVFLDGRIMMLAMRLDSAEPVTARAQRIGGQLRDIIRGGGDPLQLWNKFLPDAREIARKSFRCGDIFDALSQLADGDSGAAMALIDAELEADPLEIAIARANSSRMLDHMQIDTPKGRRDGFYSMVRALFRGRLSLPNPLYDALKSAIMHLNRNGYFHNDLHERNIMVSHDRTELFLIDFATATHMENTSGGDMGILNSDGLFYAAADACSA